MARDEVQTPVDYRRYGAEEVKLIPHGALPSLQAASVSVPNDVDQSNSGTEGTGNWGFAIALACIVIFVGLPLFFVGASGGFDTVKPPSGVAPNRQRSEPGPAPTSTLIIVHVPADATVYVNDKLMTMRGTERRYYSSDLSPEKRYQFRVRAEVAQHGTSQVKTLYMHPGETKSVTFDFGSGVRGEVADGE
jgi:uncharacterized protein (TIGR03000 family)